MTLLAGDVIDAARDRHMAFDREGAPQGVCLRFLSQYARELHGKIMEIDEDVLRVEQSYALPLADFSAGLALPANRTIVAIAAQTTDAVPRTVDVTLVPANLKNDRNTPMGAAWQIGNTLYLRGAATDWKNIGSVAVAFVGVPAPLTKSSDAILLPDTSERALIENLALALALRGHSREGIPPIDTRAFGVRAADAEQAYLAEVRNRLTGRTFQTRDVMHYYD